MKPVIVALSLALVASACKKETRDVRYDVKCMSCYVEWVNDDEVWDGRNVGPAFEVQSHQVDTNLIIGGVPVDTLLTVTETVQVAATWSYSFEADEDQCDNLEVRPAYGSALTIGTTSIDGAVLLTDTVEGSGRTISLHVKC